MIVEPVTEMSEWGRCCILKSVYTAAVVSPFDPDIGEEETRFDAPGLPPHPHRRPWSSILWTPATARDLQRHLRCADIHTKSSAWSSERTAHHIN